MSEPTKKVRYYENGNIDREEYYLNGKRHRVDSPAYIEYYKNGKVFSEEYYLNGKSYNFV